MRINEAYYKKNFKINKKGIKYYDVKTTEDIGVFGLYNYRAEEVFKRIPDEVAFATSEQVALLYTNPAGGRIRFKTDSEDLIIRSVFPDITNRSIMSMLNSAGFDIYISINGKETYFQSVYPPIDLTDMYEKYIDIGKGLKEITIYMPLYNNVKDVFIGIDEKAEVIPYSEYTHKIPVIFYGSSITQGASVSRPGMTYEAILSRMFNVDHLNLGFASAAKAEDSIIDYMSQLDFSVFVCDYDYNAPSAEYLASTHEKLYKKIRKTHPDTPFVMISKPILLLSSDNVENAKRRQIILDTYNKALSSGDKNVFFIDGSRIFFGCESGECCADGVHPNDLGAIKIAEAIKKIFLNINFFKEFK